MANIKVTIDYPISDGTKLKFRTPCESTEVEGLVVKYPIINGVGYALKTFRFVDAHGTELSGIGNVFTSDVLIEVLLDVTKGRAFIKNADTNSYIEDIKVTVKRMDEERQKIFAEAGKAIKECNEATNSAKMSAYDIAVKNGFKGTETEWLKSLKGDRGNKGDKGNNGNGVVRVGSTDEINTDAVYLIDDKMYYLSSFSEVKKITLPINEALYVDIPAGAINNYGLLEIATFDDENIVTVSDNGNGINYSIETLSTGTLDVQGIYGTPINIIGASGLEIPTKITVAEDCEEYIYTDIDIVSVEVKEVATRNNVSNDLKGSASGTSVLLTDVSPVPHELKVNVTPKVWDTNVSTPFYFVGDTNAFGDISFKKQPIKITEAVSGTEYEHSLNGIPLLIYYNGMGGGDGVTLIYLSDDFTTFFIYETDLANVEPWLVGAVPIINTLIDLNDSSDFDDWHSAEGQGTDICGNWEQIKQYFTTKLIENIEVNVHGKNLAEIKQGYGSYGGSLTTTIIVKGGENNNTAYSLVKVQGGRAYSIFQKDFQSRNFRLFFYDKEPKIYMPNEAINPDDYSIDGIYLTNTYGVHFTAPTNAKYMFVQWSKDSIKYPPKEAQIELGSKYTEYEPFVGFTTHTPNKDGSVDGVKGLYPTTILTTDVDGALIEVEYNRDLNKAFDELVKAIISLGGNV